MQHVLLKEPTLLNSEYINLQLPRLNDLLNHRKLQTNGSKSRLCARLKVYDDYWINRLDVLYDVLNDNNIKFDRLNSDKKESLRILVTLAHRSYNDYMINSSRIHDTINAVESLTWKLDAESMKLFYNANRNMNYRLTYPNNAENVAVLVDLQRDVVEMVERIYGINYDVTPVFVITEQNVRSGQIHGVRFLDDIDRVFDIVEFPLGKSVVVVRDVRYTLFDNYVSV